LNQEIAENLARDARYFAAMPEKSIQNSKLTFAPHDLIGLVGRLRPFMGPLGTTPAVSGTMTLQVHLLKGLNIDFRLLVRGQI